MTASPPPVRRSTIFIIGVTGAIGRAVAERFRRQGWVVGGCARAAGEAVPGVTVHIGDAGNYAELEAALSAFVEASGAIDLLCTCSGAIECGDFLDIPVAEQQRMIGSVFGNVVNVVHAGVSRMGGDTPMIVVTSSVAASVAVPKFVTYSAAQSAVEALADGLARELGRSGIRIGIVMVGKLSTPPRRPSRYWKRTTEGAPEAKAYIAPDVEDHAGAMRGVAAASVAEAIANLHRKARVGRLARAHAPFGVRLFELSALLFPQLVRRKLDRYAFHYVAGQTDELSPGKIRPVRRMQAGDHRFVQNAQTERLMQLVAAAS